MQWTFQNQIIDEIPEGYIGFVYIITNNITGQKYIGKKLAKFSKTTYKIVKLKNGNKLDLASPPRLTRRISRGRGSNLGSSNDGHANLFGEADESHN